MWDGLFMLLTLSAIMAVSSFLAGSLPLSFSLSQRQLRFISALGTGVLVGTALIVIIPEGVETLYNAGSSSGGHTHARREEGLAAYRRRFAAEEAPHIAAPESWLAPRHHVDVDARDAVDSDHLLTDVEEDGTSPAAAPAGSSDHSSPAPDADADSAHAMIGVALTLGFILMYLIDILPAALSARRPRPQRPQHISLSHLSQGLHSPSPSSPLPGDLDAGGSAAGASGGTPSTTIGLVIHAVADGIALGASTTGGSGGGGESGGGAGSPGLGLVVFVAIMLHKAPAAFGLTSVLLKQGYGKRAARAHLGVFSLAAPVGAVATWAVVNLFGGAAQGAAGGAKGAREWWTGVVLIFSGGTFLYVSVQSVMPQAGGHGHAHPAELENGFVDEPYGPRTSAVGHKGPSLAESGIAVLGMLLPLLTQVGHAHGH
ncbi:Zinc/iron permease [Lineolata rhizophorae]|uniref:Zinc/iron permease n=1 Tax=Lineolata rhizophorae TaxID=578093 RepID=A0A6A6NXL7_9PEZI|nr:Zinc/iron permease [Lineolata rhizophorae]